MTTINCADGYAIDPHCKYQGKIHGDYTCTLNQTDIKTNKNKFYIMQIIDKSAAGSSGYSLFIRYGRMGETGRISYQDSTSASDCVLKFEKQFVAKTKNSWRNRTNFVKHKDKYFLCELSYEDVLDKNDDKDESELEDSGKKGKKLVIPDCTLEARVQEFLRLVSDVKMMQDTLIQLEIDVKKMPLGKISANQIEQAYQLLRQIQQSLKDSGQADYMDLSSEFYTLIPYACGRSKPPVINNTELVNKFTEMVEELRNIEIANSVVEHGDDEKGKMHPLDSIYLDIETTIKPLDKDGEMWKIIENYVMGTHAPTHNSYTIELLDVYEVDRKGEREKYEKYCADHGIGDGERMLLWHGTRLSNYLSILKKGMLLRPDVIPGVYIAGKMFGYGIYGASSFSKSFNYTGWNSYDSKASDGTACLFLAEFATGKMDKRLHHDYYITEQSLASKGYNSCWGQGGTTPANRVVKDGVVIPQGPLKQVNINGSLLYDEHIIYNQDQIYLKYIVKVRGKSKY